MPNFSKITEPLVSLMKKYARLKWIESCQCAFDYLKSSLTVIPLMAFSDPSKDYVLYTDASDSAIGACLVQTSDDEEGEVIPKTDLLQIPQAERHPDALVDRSERSFCYSLWPAETGPLPA